jgi:anti-sigma regulatory factor (Ser/Thr protein kinase)
MSSPDPSATGSEVLAVDQLFDADGLYALRAALAAHASRLGAAPPVLDRLLIVVGELASNAVRHGGGSGRLRLWRTGTELRCQIIDQGSGMADPTAGSHPPGPMATSGRGMWICRQLCADLIIDSGNRGTVVTAVLSLR